MSETTSFNHPRNFPFSLSSVVGSGYDYVGGLTKAQAKQFWWNMESVAVATTGEFLDGPSNINASASIPGASITVPTVNALVVTGAETVARIPSARVIVESDYAASALFSDTDSEGNARTFNLDIRVIIDPDDPDLYALAYRFSMKVSIEGGSEFNPGCLICNPQFTDGLSGDPEFSGVVIFGDVDFNWIGGGFYFGTMAWVPMATGFTITMTPSFFTYPA